MTSLAAVAATSKRRARLGWWRGVVVALFTVTAFLSLAARVERQDAQLREYVRAQCEARRTAVLQTNANWVALARVEEADTSTPPGLREARLRIYQDAKLVVPVCD